jgi:hypothetical protein
MTWNGFRRTGNPSSRSQALLPSVGPRRFYGAYKDKRVHSPAETIVIAWNRKRPRKGVVTLPSTPFDFGDDAQ